MIDLALPHLEDAAADGRDAAARGDWQAAEAAFRRAHDAAEASGATADAAVALTNAGQAALHAGALDDADALLERAVAMRESLVAAGEARGAVVGRALGDLAVVRHARGARDEALALLARAALAADDGDAPLAGAYRRAMEELSPASTSTAAPRAAAPAPALLDVEALDEPAADEPALDDLVAIDLPESASPTTGLPMLAMTGEYAAIAPDPAAATTGLPMLDVDDEPSAPDAATTAVSAPADLEPLDLDVGDLALPAAPAIPAAVPAMPDEPGADDAIDALALDDLLPGASTGTPSPAAEEATAIPALRIDDGFDAELAPPGEAAAIPSLDIETHDLSVDPAIALADAPSIELEALVPGADAEPTATGDSATSVESLALDDLSPVGSAPSPLAALDLDALELAGIDPEPSAAAAVAAAPTGAEPPAEPTELDELAFLRGPLPPSDPTATPKAEPPIEQVLAELDVELGMATASVARGGTPLSSPTAPGEDAKPSLWQRLRGKAKR